jgi:hypothetical protein
MTAEVPDYLVAGNTVKPNNIEFRLQGDNAPQEIIRLDSKGFHYRGQLIEDAGEAHRLMVEFLKQSTQSQPEPAAPTDEELLKLFGQFDVEGMNGETHGMPLDTFWDEYQPREALAFARAVLARWGTPAVEPVPVSERLPGPENKTTDDECWFWDPISGCWFLLPGPPLNDYYTHWLPHHSLPIPRSGTQYDG